MPSPAPIEAPAAAAEHPVSSLKEKPDVSQVMRSQIDADRARRLGERFQISIEPNEWITARAEKTIYRVEKPIRMRIHRTCHRCNTSFGSHKVCPACEHRSCTRCPRYPPKKDKTAEKEVKPEPLVAAKHFSGDIEVDDYYNLRETILLTLPSRTGGQALVRKKPMQRVRRNCHACSTLFPGGSKVCPSCQHLRCVDCPRDP